jgi:mono/diheme cytochrome c family protein
MLLRPVMRYVLIMVMALQALGCTQQRELRGLPREGVDAELADAGARYFHSSTCFTCHGPGGRGTRLAPPLTDGIWRHRVRGSPDELAEIIRSGIDKPLHSPGSMPPLGGANYVTEEEMRALSAYLYTIAGWPGRPPRSWSERSSALPAVNADHAPPVHPPLTPPSAQGVPAGRYRAIQEYALGSDTVVVQAELILNSDGTYALAWASGAGSTRMLSGVWERAGNRLGAPILHLPVSGTFGGEVGCHLHTGSASRGLWGVEVCVGLLLPPDTYPTLVLLPSNDVGYKSGGRSDH